jgi:hypothetical protein
MTNLEYTKHDVNLEVLDESLHATLDDNYLGLSYTKDRLTIHLANKATAVEATAIEQQLAAHDATQRSPAQQKEDQRQAALAQAADDVQWNQLSVEDKLEALRRIVAQ